MATTIELTPELEATFARAGLAGSFLALPRRRARALRCHVRGGERARLRDHIKPDASYAECAIATFAAKYA